MLAYDISYSYKVDNFHNIGALCVHGFYYQFQYLRIWNLEEKTRH